MTSSAKGYLFTGHGGAGTGKSRARGQHCEGIGAQSLAPKPTFLLKAEETLRYLCLALHSPKPKECVRAALAIQLPSLQTFKTRSNAIIYCTRKDNVKFPVRNLETKSMTEQILRD